MRNVFAQVVFAELGPGTILRRILTSTLRVFHMYSTFQVSVYQNYSVRSTCGCCYEQLHFLKQRKPSGPYSVDTIYEVEIFKKNVI